MHDLITRIPPVAEREVIAHELQIETCYRGVEHPQSLLEQLLPRLVTLHHNDRLRIHSTHLCK
jgi:hypothetical protein